MLCDAELNELSSLNRIQTTSECAESTSTFTKKKQRSSIARYGISLVMISLYDYENTLEVTGSAVFTRDGQRFYRATTIDIKAISELVGEPIDLWKFDCEGAEFAVLMSKQANFLKGHILYVEYHVGQFNDTVYEAAEDPTAYPFNLSGLIARIQNLGYRITLVNEFPHYKGLGVIHARSSAT